MEVEAGRGTVDTHFPLASAPSLSSTVSTSAATLGVFNSLRIGVAATPSTAASPSSGISSDREAGRTPLYPPGAAHGESCDHHSPLPPHLRPPSEMELEFARLASKQALPPWTEQEMKANAASAIAFIAAYGKSSPLLAAQRWLQQANLVPGQQLACADRRLQCSHADHGDVTSVASILAGTASCSLAHAPSSGLPYPSWVSGDQHSTTAGYTASGGGGSIHVPSSSSTWGGSSDAFSAFSTVGGRSASPSSSSSAFSTVGGRSASPSSSSSALSSGGGCSASPPVCVSYPPST